MVFEMALVAWMTVFLTIHQCFSMNIPCQEPSDEDLELKLNHLIPGYRSLFPNQGGIPDRDVKQCPQAINQSSELIQDRSTSPWSYRVNKDPNRYPQRLTEAYCLCEECITTHIGERTAARSKQAFINVPVLRKTPKCRKGRYVYRLKYLRLASFCLCHLP